MSTGVNSIEIPCTNVFYLAGMLAGIFDIIKNKVVQWDIMLGVNGGAMFIVAVTFAIKIDLLRRIKLFRLENLFS